MENKNTQASGIRKPFADSYLCKNLEEDPMSHTESKKSSMVRVLQEIASPEALEWFEGQVNKLEKADSATALYMAYTLCGQYFSDKMVPKGKVSFLPHLPTEKELARLALLSEALEKREDFYGPRVLKLIQVADTQELITFLKYLVVLPAHGDFVLSAVEALRTNISDVFEAIALDNPYPKAFFNQQQWNQMYLKAAFMQLDLTRMDGVEERANAELTRIISDYAHERWAASRQIDPCIWRPVSAYLEEELLGDMKRLFSSEFKAERLAAYCIAKTSGHPELAGDLEKHAELQSEVKDETQVWLRVRDLWNTKTK